MPTFRGVRLVSNPNAVLRNGLAAEWLMNESGSTLTDTSGNGNDGTIHGASWYTLPSGYKVLSFDGDDYIVVPQDASLEPVNAITLSAWIFMEADMTDNRILDKGSFGAYKGYVLTVRPGNSVRFYVGDGTTAITATSGNLNKDVWYHVVGIFDGRYVRLYVDSSLVETSDFGYNTQLSHIASIYIASEGGTSAFFTGKLGITRIYRRALQPWEIQVLYNYDKALMGV